MRTAKVRFVCPTYCLEHFVHVIPYTTLFDLQVPDFIVWYVRPVTGLRILPDVLSLEQYLHFFFLVHMWSVTMPFLNVSGLKGTSQGFFTSALTSKSRRFFGRLYPGVNFQSSTGLDDEVLSSKSKFFLSIGSTMLPPGWKVVVRKISCTGFGTGIPTLAPILT